MTESSTPEGTGGLTVADAADRFAAMLSQEDGTGGETEGDEPQTDPEDEPEEQSEGAEGEEQSDEDEDNQAEVSEQPDDTMPVKLTLDGQEVEVTLHELKRGFLREADYTRKTQALTQERNALEADKQGYALEREQAKAILGAWEQQLATPLYDPAETEALRFTDPAEWAARKQEENERVAQLQDITGRKAQLTEQEARQQAANHQRAVAETEQKLLEAIPEWKDGAVAKRGLDEIWAYAGSHGFTPQEILADPDHRALLILRDAAAYQAIKTKRPAVEKKVAAVKTAAPGASRSLPSKETEALRARQRLAKSNSVDDAVALFSQMKPPT